MAVAGVPRILAQAQSISHAIARKPTALAGDEPESWRSNYTNVSANMLAQSGQK